MIVDPNTAAIILGVSNLNPIQLWSPDKLTFNQTKIKLIPTKRYLQTFDFLESLYNRLDIAFNEALLEDWDATVTYQTGDKVYDPTTQTRWVSTEDGNINNEPNPLNSSPGSPSTHWDHSPLIGAPIDYDFGTTYNTGDRALAYFGLGTAQYVVQSLADGNTGNQPNGYIGVWWDYVTESRGISPKLRMYADGVLIATLDFINVRPHSTHQYINWLWSIFPEAKDAIITLDVYDPVSELVLAVSDCLRVVSYDAKPSLTIKYTNSDDFHGIAFEGANQEFYIRLNAVFYEETHPVDSEDYNLSTGIIVSLRKQMVTKRLLNIIEFLPEFMHKKIEQILMCDYVEIDELPWKKQGDEYQRSLSEASLLSTAKVLLTQADSVLVNISKGDILSASGVFSDEFSAPFA